MEEAITTFCLELSLGSILEEKTEHCLPTVIRILRSHLHLFFLIMNFTGSYQEQNRCQKNHLRIYLLEVLNR